MPNRDDTPPWLTGALSNLRAEAEHLAALDAIVSGHRLLRRIADDLERRAADWGEQLLTPAQAEAETDLTSDHLRRLVRGGVLRNHGTAGKALYRRAELCSRRPAKTHLLPTRPSERTVPSTREQIARAVVTSRGGD